MKILVSSEKKKEVKESLMVHSEPKYRPNKGIVVEHNKKKNTNIYIILI